jgi:3-hydroxyacyl-[acyl-carrier-protein] dehydratase
MNIRSEVKAALREARREDGGATLCARFVYDTSAAVFAGHFPGQPLLPAVFHIEMFRCAMEAATGTAYEVTEVRRGKFPSIVRPGDTVELRASIAGDDRRWLVRGECFARETLAASLTMVLSPVRSE